MSAKKKTLLALAFLIWISALVIPVWMAHHKAALHPYGFDTVHVGILAGMISGALVFIALYFAYWIFCRVR